MIFELSTGILILAAVFSYLNSRFFKLQPLIAFMLGAFIFSLILRVLNGLDWEPATSLIELFSQVDFSYTVLYEILSFLLFAGALQTNIREMAEQKWVILFLSTISVVISTFIVGTFMWLVFRELGFYISYLYALVFGALISPTDPIIVIGILKRSLMSRSLRIKIVGEALFNDGIAIVLFVVLVGLARFGGEVIALDVTWLLLKQLVGSVGLGLFYGWLMHKLLYKISDFNTQVFITLGIVAGGYDLALWFGISGPITIVIAGLFFRNYRPSDTLPERAYHELYGFWGLVDELLNAGLFILMGLEILAFKFSEPYLIAAFLAIFVVLLGRFISVWVPIRVFSVYQKFNENALQILTWAGLRGGISLALALTLPGDPGYNILAFITYAVVIFSLTIQVFVLQQLLK